MRAAAIAERKEDRRLIFESKLENAERIKKLQQMRVAELAQKMEVTQRRLEHMKVSSPALYSLDTVAFHTPTHVRAQVVRKAVKEEKKHKKHAEIVDTDMLKKKLEQERPKSPVSG